MTNPEVTLAPPDVTTAVKVTAVPHATVFAAEPPEEIARAVVLDVGAADRTSMFSRAVAERAPEVPVMVARALPNGAEFAAVKVTTPALPDDAGFHAAVTPAGRPEIEKLTTPLNPFTATVAFAMLPGVRERMPGEGVSVKEGAITVNVNEVDAVIAPEVPVTVTV